MGDTLGELLLEEIRLRMTKAEKQDVESRAVHPRCPSCGSSYLYGARYCGHCGVKRELRVPSQNNDDNSRGPLPVSCF